MKKLPLLFALIFVSFVFANEYVKTTPMGNYLVSDYPNLKLMSIKEEHCLWLNDSDYKICSPLIELNSTEKMPLSNTSIFTSLNSEYNVTQYNISYSNTYNLANYTYLNESLCTYENKSVFLDNGSVVQEEVCRPTPQNYTYRNYTNFTDVTNNDTINISSGYSALRVTFKVPKYSYGVYGFKAQEASENTESTNVYVLDPDISACGTLSANTQYTLTQDIRASGNCFIFNDSSKLDCQYHKIIGNGSGAAMYSDDIASLSHVAMKNCLIDNFTYGIYSYYLQSGGTSSSTFSYYDVENNIANVSRLAYFATDSPCGWDQTNCVFKSYNKYNTIYNNTGSIGDVFQSDLDSFGSAGDLYTENNNIKNNVGSVVMIGWARRDKDGDCGDAEALSNDIENNMHCSTYIRHESDNGYAYTNSNKVINNQGGYVTLYAGSNMDAEENHYEDAYVQSNTISNNDMSSTLRSEAYSGQGGAYTKSNSIQNNNFGELFLEAIAHDDDAYVQSNTAKNNKFIVSSGYSIYMKAYASHDNSANIVSNTLYNNVFKGTYNPYIHASSGSGGSTSSSNTWNTSNSTGPNIANGPYIGGNAWEKPDYTGYSDTCQDDNEDGFCDSSYTVASGSNVDYLPLVNPLLFTQPQQIYNISVDEQPTYKVIAFTRTKYNGTCNYTNLPLDHTQIINVTNSSGVAVNYTNGSTWVAWTCNLTAGNDTVYFKMPAPYFSSYKQKPNTVDNLSLQHLSLKITNPSSLAVENVSISSVTLPCSYTTNTNCVNINANSYTEVDANTSCITQLDPTTYPLDTYYNTRLNYTQTYFYFTPKQLLQNNLNASINLTIDLPTCEDTSYTNRSVTDILPALQQHVWSGRIRTPGITKSNYSTYDSAHNITTTYINFSTPCQDSFINDVYKNIYANQTVNASLPNHMLYYLSNNNYYSMGLFNLTNGYIEFNVTDPNYADNLWSNNLTQYKEVDANYYSTVSTYRGTTPETNFPRGREQTIKVFVFGNPNQSTVNITVYRPDGQLYQHWLNLNTANTTDSYKKYANVTWTIPDTAPLGQYHVIVDTFQPDINTTSQSSTDFVVQKLSLSIDVSATIDPANNLIVLETVRDSLNNTVPNIMVNTTIYYPNNTIMDRYYQIPTDINGQVTFSHHLSNTQTPGTYTVNGLAYDPNGNYEQGSNSTTFKVNAVYWLGLTNNYFEAQVYVNSSTTQSDTVFNYGNSQLSNIQCSSNTSWVTCSPTSIDSLGLSSNYTFNIKIDGSSSGLNPPSSGQIVYANLTFKSTNSSPQYALLKITVYPIPTPNLMQLDPEYNSYILDKGDSKIIRFKLNNTGTSDAYQTYCYVLGENANWSNISGYTWDNPGVVTNTTPVYFNYTLNIPNNTTRQDFNQTITCYGNNTNKINSTVSVHVKGVEIGTYPREIYYSMYSNTKQTVPLQIQNIGEYEANSISCHVSGQPWLKIIDQPSATLQPNQLSYFYTQLDIPSNTPVGTYNIQLICSAPDPSVTKTDFHIQVINKGGGGAGGAGGGAGINLNITPSKIEKTMMLYTRQTETIKIENKAPFKTTIKLSLPSFILTLHNLVFSIDTGKTETIPIEIIPTEANHVGNIVIEASGVSNGNTVSGRFIIPVKITLKVLQPEKAPSFLKLLMGELPYLLLIAIMLIVIGLVTRHKEPLISNISLFSGFVLLVVSTLMYLVG